MRYRIEFLDAALKGMAKLPRSVQRLVGRRLEVLAEDPRAPFTQPLAHDLKGRRGFRVGDIRVVYAIEDDVLTVIVIDVGLRGLIYRRASRRQ